LERKLGVLVYERRLGMLLSRDEEVPEEMNVMAASGKACTGRGGCNCAASEWLTVTLGKM